MRFGVRAMIRTEVNQSVCIHGIADSPTVAHVNPVFLIFRVRVRVQKEDVKNHIQNKK